MDVTQVFSPDSFISLKFEKVQKDPFDRARPVMSG
jgi:hypothetical protein